MALEFLPEVKLLMFVFWIVKLLISVVTPCGRVDTNVFLSGSKSTRRFDPE
jgi:hypothetical protein